MVRINEPMINQPTSLCTKNPIAMRLSATLFVPFIRYLKASKGFVMMRRFIEINYYIPKPISPKDDGKTIVTYGIFSITYSCQLIVKGLYHTLETVDP